MQEPNSFLSKMNRTALVQTLTMSEKNHSIVKIKTIRGRKPIIGAVQKVLSQVIILRSANAGQITLTLGDIESVKGPHAPFLMRVMGLVHGLARMSRINASDEQVVR